MSCVRQPMKKPLLLSLIHISAKADIVVLCSSDDEYADYAVPAFKALNGRAMFIVAGAPACMDELKAAGIENFIHVRVNVLETLDVYKRQECGAACFGTSQAGDVCHYCYGGYQYDIGSYFYIPSPY